VILDPIGGDYVARDLAALAPHGRIALIGTQGGAEVRFPAGALMGRWAHIHGSTLRSRSAEEKDKIVLSMVENVWPMLDAGSLGPVIDSRYPLADAATAHRRMGSSKHIGKILLEA
jgi:NADPH:quinone reductase-like Zn-dependent oxidoreductase